MIHSRATKPRIFPWNSNRAPEQIDRAQDLGGDLTLTQTKLYEIGRDGKLGVNKETPKMALTLRQFENGSMAFFRALANKENPASGGLDESIDLDDIKSTYFDISTYLTDDNSSFRGTAWFPKLRVNGFSINVGSPDAIVERSFDLVGEDYKVITDNYLAFETGTVSAPGIYTLALSPAPIEYASGKRIFRVLRVRGSEVAELVEDATSTYDADTWRYSAGSVIVQTCLADDIVKVFYPAATAYTTLWADNDVDAEALFAKQCTVYLKVGVGANQQVYRLQSVGIDVAFDRTDYKEIGNAEVVQTGVKSKTVTVTLGRILEDFTLEEVLRGTSIYEYIDARNFSSDITLTVKIYTDSTKTAFKMGYKIASLSPTALSNNSTVEDYDSANDTMESDNLMVTTDESEL
jgi:hypothetical protein